MRSFKKFILESDEQAQLNEAIEVRHDRYMRSHGKKASGGTGSWMFTHKDMGDVDYNNEKEVHTARGKFSDAKKSAQQWAKKHGHSTVYVMESVELDEDMNALTTAAAMAPAAALAASGLLYKGYGKSKRSVMDRIADTKDAKKRHKDSIKQADKYLSKSTNPKTLDKYKKQKDYSQNKLKQSSYIKSLSRKEEVELDEAIKQGSKEHLKKLQGMLDKVKPGSADHSQIRGAIESMFGKQHIPAKHRNVKPDVMESVELDENDNTSKLTKQRNTVSGPLADRRKEALRKKIKDARKAEEDKIRKNLGLDEKLKASDDMGTWVKDFQDSDAPQFKGKSQKKRQQMAVAAKLSAERNEEVELDELSRDTLASYHKKAMTQLNPIASKHSQAQKQMTARIRSGKSLTGYTPKSALSPEEEKIRKKRLKGGRSAINKINKMDEGVELDEVSTERLRDYASAALQDKNKAKADKRWKYASKAMNTVADREVKAAHARKYNKMEEVELDQQTQYDLVESYLLENNIDVDTLSVEQLDEIIGKVVGGAFKLGAKAVTGAARRMSTAGRADAAEKRAAAAEKKNKDRERIKKAQARLRAAQQAARA